MPSDQVAIINANGGAIKDAVGIPEEQLRRAAKSAVCKINIDSDGRLAMTAAIRQVFAQKPAEFDPRKYIGPARDALKELYKHKNEARTRLCRSRIIGTPEGTEACRCFVTSGSSSSAISRKAVARKSGGFFVSGVLGAEPVSLALRWGAVVVASVELGVAGAHRNRYATHRKDCDCQNRRTASVLDYSANSASSVRVLSGWAAFHRR